MVLRFLHRRLRVPVSLMGRFLAAEAAGGTVLMAVSGLALMLANSAWAPWYFDGLRVEVFGWSVHQVINDGLMTLFFLLVGLEIRRELGEGELATWRSRVLPGVAALAGMLVPACIYVGVNLGDAVGIDGWAIPSATDIAFALGVLALLGKRVPVSLKVFLAALAILDDLGAIVIIGVFYSGSLDGVALALAAAVMVALAVLSRRKVAWLPAYAVLGAALWALVLHSGVHATLAGVLLALAVPRTVGERMARALQHWVAFVVVPAFGFANAGVALGGLAWKHLLEPVTLGVMAGLFVGKQVGVLGSVWLLVRLGLARLPAGAGWLQMYGVSVLCGIGFTMSLFIGLLAFAQAPYVQEAVKVGVLAGSGLSAVLGLAVLAWAGRNKRLI